MVCLRGGGTKRHKEAQRAQRGRQKRWCTTDEHNVKRNAFTSRPPPHFSTTTTLFHHHYLPTTLRPTGCCIMVLTTQGRLAGPVSPSRFMACTVNWYDCPGTRSSTVHFVLWVGAPGDEKRRKEGRRRGREKQQRPSNNDQATTTKQQPENNQVNHHCCRPHGRPHCRPHSPRLFPSPYLSLG